VTRITSARRAGEACGLLMFSRKEMEASLQSEEAPLAGIFDVCAVVIALSGSPLMLRYVHGSIR
jgi:hypothetical protein